MPYNCQFCGEIEEGEMIHRCGSCGGTRIVRGALGDRCADCEEGALTHACPTCGSEEVEA